jgi:hypothetical protein
VHNHDKSTDRGGRTGAGGTGEKVERRVWTIREESAVVVPGKDDHLLCGGQDEQPPTVSAWEKRKRR